MVISVGGAVVIGGEGGGAPLSDATPAALGTAAAGAGTTASRDDHVHAMPTAAQVGAAARTATTPAFDTGQGWTIVAATSPNAGSSAATFQSGNVARIALGTTGAALGLSGPRVERAITWNPRARWCFRVTPHAVLNTSGYVNLDLYIRDSTGAEFRTSELTGVSSPGNLYATGSGVSAAGPANAVCAWDGTGTLELRVDAGIVTFGAVNAAGLYTPLAGGSAAALPFVPSHVGITAQVGTATVGYAEATDLVIEAIG